MIVPVRQTKQEVETDEVAATVEFAPDEGSSSLSSKVMYVHGKAERLMTERSQKSVLYRKKWEKLHTSLNTYCRSSVLLCGVVQ